MDRFSILVFLALLSFSSEDNCFQCPNSNDFISYSLRCDAKFDCPDGSDEANCIESKVNHTRWIAVDN